MKKNGSFFECSNSLCTATFYRTPADLKISEKYYCSRSCAVTINNQKYPKRKAIIRSCIYCHNAMRESKSFCSIWCRKIYHRPTKEKIIKDIIFFYEKSGRIPYKREFTKQKTARQLFGTWNKAIIAAGYNPNPVKFAKRYKAKDGHMCDSFAEKIIDDWLNRNQIAHERNVLYPEGKYNADFKVGNTYMEFFGLKGHERYDAVKSKKLRIAKKYQIKLIALHPKDVKNLEKVLTLI